MTSSLFLAIALAAGFGFQDTAKNDEPSYRILMTRVPVPPELPGLQYFVSVQKFLDRPGLEGLICRLMDQQRPQLVPRISVDVYQGLKTISLADLVIGGKPFEDEIAQYEWSSNATRFTIYKDAEGKRLNKFAIYEFDHTKACGH